MAKKYRISPIKIDNYISQYGSMENYIKAYREGRVDRNTNLNLCIDVSSKTNKRAKSIIIEKIYGHYSLYLIDGDKILEDLNTIKPEINAEILRYRLGIKDSRIYSLEEVGRMFGLSGEGIRQKENKAFRILQSHKDRYVVYSEYTAGKPNFTPEGAARRKLLLDTIYNSNLIWVPDKEYEQEADSIQPSELRKITTELKSIQPVQTEEKHSKPNIIKNEAKSIDKNDSIGHLGLAHSVAYLLKSAGIHTITQLREISIEELSKINHVNKECIMHIQSKLESFPKSKDDYIENLNLSVRSFNCLTRAGIRSISQLQEMSTEDLLQVRSLGKKSIEEIQLKIKCLDESREQKDSKTLPQGEISELEKARAKRDELVQVSETLKQQTKEAEQLLESYSNLLDGNAQKGEETPDLKGE